MKKNIIKLKKQILTFVLSAAMILTNVPITYSAVNNNIALEKTCVASEELSNCPASNAVDGNPLTRWASNDGTDTAWLQVDLGTNKPIKKFIIKMESNGLVKYKKYHIDLSNNGSNWSTAYTTPTGRTKQPLTEEIILENEVSARYVKLIIDEHLEGSYPSISVCEFEIYSKAESNINTDDVNLALDKAVTAYKSPISYWGPEKVTDGIVNREANKQQQSRWSSEIGAPGWIIVDLKESQSFGRINIEWEVPVIKNYHIEISDDGKNFNSIYTSPTEAIGFPVHNQVKFASPIKARYVKICVDELIENAYPSVSIYEIEILSSAKINKALGKNVTASANELMYTAERAVDGIINRDVANKSEQSRWSSGTGNGSWLCIDLGRLTRFNNFVANWETVEDVIIRNYHIEVSNDKVNWETIYSTPSERIPALRESVILDDNYTARYVKIVADSVEKYPSVSLYEFELYEDLDFISVEDMAKNLTVEPISANDTYFKLPVSAGLDVSFVGADYEQIIKSDLSISKPLVDTDVLVSFEVSNKNKTKKAFSPEFKVRVPGQYKLDDSINPKPKVIPELQEWFGRQGDFTITGSSKIVVDTSCGSEFMKLANMFADDYEDITGMPISVVQGTKADVAKSDFYFKLSKETLEKETYLMDVADNITVSATHPTGSYWATRTILQILKQNKTTIPQGIIRDYPKFKVRGVMLDVGRQPVPLYFLKEWAKTMSWYKMNDFQVHLNDMSFAGDYDGFRLESDVPNLSSDDLVYKKEQFRDFLIFAKQIGVNIVPEFDSPGHAGAFTRARPDLARENNKAYLDVENPESIEFIKSVFDEYMEKVDPVFLDDTVVHIGTDEYKGGGQKEKEAFRAYQDNLLKYIRDEKKHTPRVWGSQTENNGVTPITAKGVQMDLWYRGYANPETMFKLGYDLININDGDVYIVPGAGYYYDYLSKNHIYKNWNPNVVAGYHIPAGHPQILGGAYALWNDKSGPKNDIGVSEAEMFDRLYDIVPMFAAKTWGDGQDYTLEQIENLAGITNYAPNSNPTHIVKTKEDNILSLGFDESDPNLDASTNKYNITKKQNIQFDKGYAGNALTLKGGCSYVETPISDLKFGSTLDFWVKKDSDAREGEQILFESNIGAIKAVQKDTGRFGFSRDLRDYSFNYTLPNDVWTHITIVTQYTRTSLYIDGKKVDELARDKTGGKFATLIMPLNKIGSSTKAFKGQIDQINVYNSIINIDSTDSEEKVALRDAITSAENLIKNAVVGVEIGKYPQTAVDEFSKAIQTAKSILTNIISTNGQYIKAKSALVSAIKKLSDAVIKEQSLEDACQTVQSAVNGITPKNETTADSILAIAQAAISNKEIKASWSKDVVITAATKDSAGSIIGTLTLTLNDNSNEVTVNLIIPKLGETDPKDQTLEQAVKAVQSAINGITPTNETTADSILAIAQAAISNKEIKAAWSKDVVITAATKDSVGSIIGTLTLTLNENSNEVTVNLIIPKLGETDPKDQTLEQAVKAVQSTVNGITATNETTANSILTIAQAAISNKEIKASLSKDVVITAATKESAGSIIGTITLTLEGKEPMEVIVRLVIAQLDKDPDPEKPSSDISTKPEHRKYIEPYLAASSDMIDKIVGASEKGNVSISVKDDYKMPTSFLTTLMENKEKSVTLNGDWYSWTFDGKDIENDMPGVIWFDTQISTDSPNADAISKLTGEADTTNLYFSYEGQLPGETVIRVQLEKYAGKPVYVYYHNPEKGRLELIQADVKADEDGWIEFSITHCSDYVVSASAIKGAVKVTKPAPAPAREAALNPEPKKELNMTNPETGGIETNTKITVSESTSQVKENPKSAAVEKSTKQLSNTNIATTVSIEQNAGNNNILWIGAVFIAAALTGSFIIAKRKFSKK